MRSVWGPLCIHSYSDSQSGVCLNSLGASSSPECCQSDNKVTPGVDMPCFPLSCATTQLTERLELIAPSGTAELPILENSL